ncbi:MAG TPA: Wzz/FepE/Etk N-terminal domain-containing protein, partial [Longimicrobium sp.]|nr:Wzz/FepE/Etk N-terminal domain-containing protein [Longimicrobium sp.]
MTDDQTPSRLPAGGGAHADGSLLDFAAVLLRRWKVVVGATLAGALLAGIYAFLQPATYTARLVLVPSASSGTDSRAQALLAQMPGLAGRIPALSA